MKPEILNQIGKFLDSNDGKRFFREITADMTNANRHSLKKTLLYPKPATARLVDVSVKVYSELSKQTNKEIT